MQRTAGRRAREVVGLYGDPDSTWGIGLDSTWVVPLDVAEMPARLEALTQAHPHLGPAVAPRVVEDSDWEAARRAVLSAPYEENGALIRLLVSSTGERLFVAAHHGAVDGLGMVAVLAAAAARRFDTKARGVGARPAERSFLMSSAQRLTEALLHPPVRFAGQASGEPGEHVLQVSMPRQRMSTASVAHAVGRCYGGWPGARPNAHPLVVTGVSRRAVGDHAPDRQTGYVRLRLDPEWSVEQTREAFRGLTPEPDFPETSLGGVAPRFIRLLRNRLGSTAQVSNLGALAADGLAEAALFPAVSGPQAVSVGAVTAGDTSTLTLRARASEFSLAEARRLLDGVAEHLRDDGGDQ